MTWHMETQVKCYPPNQSSILFISRPVRQKILLNYYYTVFYFIDRICEKNFLLYKHLQTILSFASWPVKPKIFKV